MARSDVLLEEYQRLELSIKTTQLSQHDAAVKEAQLQQSRDLSTQIFDAKKSEIDEGYKQKLLKCEEEKKALESQNQELELKDKTSFTQEQIKANQEKMIQLNKEIETLTQQRHHDQQRALEEHEARIGSRKKPESLQTQEPPTHSAMKPVKGSDQDLMLDDYKKMFEGKDWYQKNQPSQEGGKLSLPFENQEDMLRFCKDQAQQKRDFIIVDGATNKVMGYGKGGQMFHSDGKPFKDGDSFQPGAQTLDQFKFPSQPQSQMQAPNGSITRAAEITQPTEQPSIEDNEEEEEEEEGELHLVDDDEEGELHLVDDDDDEEEEEEEAAHFTPG